MASFSSTQDLIDNEDTDSGRKGDNAEKWEELKTFLWNPKINRFFDRSKDDWVKLVIFYSSFYTCLLAIFIVIMAMFLVVLDDISPAITGSESIHSFNPGLSMRPVPDHQSSLIRFEQGKPQSYKGFTDHIQAFLLQYENEAQVGENFIDCSDGRQEGTEDKVCRFDVDTLGDDCTWQKDYGYDEGQPCILFKLNKLHSWLPETLSEEEAPSSLGDRYHPEYLGLTCEGEYDADHENIGNITYTPANGFPKHFYPFLNQEGYRSPLVMVKFMGPVNGMVVNVLCKVWAKNIYHDYNELAGLMRFQLLVD